MDEGAQTIASFTGILLKRDHTIGQKFVQLVFREQDKNVLCISANPKTATLPVGQMYYVEGMLRSKGKYSFVLDPRIDLLKKHWHPIRRILYAGIGVAFFTSLGGIAYMLQGSPTATKLTSSKQAVIQAATNTVVQPAPTPPRTPVSTSSPSPAPVVARHAVVKAPITVSTSVPAPVPAPVPAIVTPAVTAPTDMCTTQVILRDTLQQADTSVAGTVLQQGADGSKQVCSLSGTTVITAPVTETVSSGPAAPDTGVPTS
jgi:hypothetical protein